MKVLFALEAGQGMGHLGRILSLASAFKRQEFEVFASVHDARMAHILSTRGLPTRTQRIVNLESSSSVPPRYLPDILFNLGMHQRDTLARAHAYYDSTFRKLGITHLVCDYAPFACLAGATAGIATTRIGTTFFNPPTGSFLDMRPWLSPETARSDYYSSTISRAIQEFLPRQLRHGDETLAALYDSSLSISTTVWQADHFPNGSGVAKLFGPLDNSLEDDEAAQWKGPAAPVLVYLPFAAPEASQLMQALNRLGRAAWWYAPDIKGSGSNANVLIGDKPFSLRSALQHAGLLVSAGGHGSACLALMSGVPHLTFPSQLETRLLSFSLAKRGLAKPYHPAERTNLSDLVDSLLVTKKIDPLAKSRQEYETHNSEESSRAAVSLILQDNINP